MRIHPHDLLLQEYAATFSEDRPECLAHLLSCKDCQDRFRSLFNLSAGIPTGTVTLLDPCQPMSADYEPALKRVSRSLQGIHSTYELERAEAPRLLGELLQHPVERRPWLARNCARFHTWGLCESLLQRSQEQDFRKAIMDEGLALLALEVLECLDATRYGAEAIEDLRARAWTYIANSRRVKADLRGSEEAFALAFASLKRGRMDPMERAEIFDFKASLLRAQRRLGKALSLLRRAAKIFLDLGEKHQAGRVLVKMSTVHLAAGEPEMSIPLLYRALSLVDPAREPRLLLSAWHNLIDNLSESGRFMEAQKILAKARPLYRQAPQPWMQNRLKWVEGKISRGLGQQRQAEVLFLEARRGFLAADAAYDTALVSLDLASLYAEQGRMADLKRIAAEMMPIFSSRQIHREALAALAYWRQAVAAEKACLDLVTGVSSFLKRARHDPELRFERPEST